MTAPARLKASRARRPLQRLVQTLVGPAAFDFWASKLHPAWSWSRPLAKIVARHSESRDSVTLLLQPNRHWQGFRAGQHLNISAEIDGIRVTRSYSLSDTPRPDGRIAITVKAIEGGKLSRYLCTTARVGDVLDLGPAFGEMALPATPGGSLLFLAAGSGITPLMALIRNLAGQGMPVSLTLLYWARSREEVCFADELRRLAAQHRGFQVRFVLTRANAVADDECQGRIGAEQLSALVPDAVQRQVYACGPGGFVDTVRTLLAAQVPQFQAEAFTPPPRLIEESGTVQVTLAASGQTLSVPRGQSLLTALEAAGLQPASGCRMGICNTCACGKRSGTTRNLHTDVVQHEPVSALRLCVSSAASDLVLDL
ncbi:ferredoxin-NADP reductase [Tahibacter aquaticus]|uniref:Ferredoxin-NADP reductase n=1 Tax=Tahibacter aquaticus TaxID=520092 RepID=A0A4R6YU64_9GAMM|nr:ferredoxin reductase [Tahibacter aquaticus]TDR42005.1 ferredoxin-NADP reductase [Tahibacter aquaticus]